MQLLSITEDNIAAYAAFRREIADEEGQRYYDTIDLAAAILTQGMDRVLQDDNGKMLAAVTICRNERRDGSNRVRFSIEDSGKDAGKLIGYLRHILISEIAEPTTTDTLCNVHNMPGCTLPAEEMTAMGFAEVPGSYRYERKPGPPLEGEFPHAERAIKLGYETVILDDAMIASNPDLFEKLAEIYNRAFSNREGISLTTAERMRKNYETPTNTIIIAKLGDEIAASTTLSNLGDSVLGPQISCLRKHWGTGVSDLICRMFTQIVADRWGLPIVAYAEAGNSASWKALERFGLVRNKEYPVWEKLIPAGEKLVI